MIRTSNRASNKLPRLKLNISRIMQKAEYKRELVTFESEIPSTYYVGCPGDGIVVITGNNGYLRINEAYIPQLIEELTEYADQLMVRRRL